MRNYKTKHKFKFQMYVQCDNILIETQRQKIPKLIRCKFDLDIMLNCVNYLKYIRRRESRKPYFLDSKIQVIVFSWHIIKTVFATS